MATLDKKARIIKVLDPVLVNRMLAEGILVRQGIDLSGRVHIETRFNMDGNGKLISARVEISK